MKVGRIDADALTRDRDQLFAEAVAQYRAGAQWWPDAAFEREHIAPEQRQRFEADPWDETIRDFAVGRKRLSVVEIARQALGFDAIAKVGTADQRRIAGVLTDMGWTLRSRLARALLRGPRGPCRMTDNVALTNRGQRARAQLPSMGKCVMCGMSDMRRHACPRTNPYPLRRPHNGRQSVASVAKCHKSRSLT